MNGIEIARSAKQQIAQLTGLEPDTVSSFVKDNGEWSVTVEVVEMKRIPNATDILATYQAKLDTEGNLLGYQRTKRYLRQQEMSEEI
jgi:hypothetical protein